ncbi:Ig-like domain-containing protein [Deinococcus radiotolerans]|uniref:Bacterial Ig-like domain-containing protein n=1 Tax=Deinococcus radiotolerans TaxID=1309407 RepID=A0ABQ2FNB0_9DEIO|nr:Ig-like domain-containing protein [Deinococcus radiotolerans]GGL10849.1 hypothetical protein GCM10010844_31900 [Deinococcus radiotolerans]
MRSVLNTTLALTTLTLALASCGQRAVTPTAKGPLMKVEVSAPAFAGQGLGAQGLTGDAPARHYDVTVRDSAGKTVTFNGTTYDPTGTGATTLTLNSANSYHRLLLLPKGDYTFENKVKDDATSATLLAYGPAAENAGTVDKNNTVIRIKSHAVYDAATSTLAPSLSMNELYTDTTFNLSLNLKTAPVNSGASATVPTSDIGPVTYTLGNVSDGVLNGAGSKIGVNVTSRGTDTDSELNVTATFQAWVQVAGTDTASYQTVSESFAKQIQTNGLTTDTVMPTLTFATASASTGAALNLTGTVGDDQGVQNVRAYVDGNLVASNNPAEQSGGVAALTGDSQGNWTAAWTPAKDGDYSVVVIAEDTSGNETRAEQTITATTPTGVTYNITPAYDWNTNAVTFMAGQVNTFKVHWDGSYSYMHVWMSVLSGPGDFTATLTAPDGSNQPIFYGGNNTGYIEFGDQYQPGDYTITMVSNSDAVIDVQAHLH